MIMLHTTHKQFTKNISIANLYTRVSALLCTIVLAIVLTTPGYAESDIASMQTEEGRTYVLSPQFNQLRWCAADPVNTNGTTDNKSYNFGCRTDLFYSLNPDDDNPDHHTAGEYTAVLFPNGPDNPDNLIVAGTSNGWLLVFKPTFVTSATTGEYDLKSSELVGWSKAETFSDSKKTCYVRSLAADPTNTGIFTVCTQDNINAIKEGNVYFGVYYPNPVLPFTKKAPAFLPSVYLGYVPLKSLFGKTGTTSPRVLSRLGTRITCSMIENSYFGYSGVRKGCGSNYELRDTAVTAGYWGGFYPSITPYEGPCCLTKFGTSGANDFGNRVYPALKTYPPNYPGLKGTPYEFTGGVFLYNIIGGFQKAIDGGSLDVDGTSYAAVNTTLMCTVIAGLASCQSTSKIALPFAESNGGGGTVLHGFGIVTAAEYGVDKNNKPTLYFHQLRGRLAHVDCVKIVDSLEFKYWCAYKDARIPARPAFDNLWDDHRTAGCTLDVSSKGGYVYAGKFAPDLYTEAPLIVEPTFDTVPAGCSSLTKYTWQTNSLIAHQMSNIKWVNSSSDPTGKVLFALSGAAEHSKLAKAPTPSLLFHSTSSGTNSLSTIPTDNGSGDSGDLGATAWSMLADDNGNTMINVGQGGIYFLNPYSNPYGNLQFVASPAVDNTTTVNRVWNTLVSVLKMGESISKIIKMVPK